MEINEIIYEASRFATSPDPTEDWVKRLHYTLKLLSFSGVRLKAPIYMEVQVYGHFKGLAEHFGCEISEKSGKDGTRFYYFQYKEINLVHQIII